MTNRRCIVVDSRDNVATLLDNETERTLLPGGLPCAPGIPFGHKAAIRPIATGEPVRKYGVTIGFASADIAVGEHVHVHNCR